MLQKEDAGVFKGKITIANLPAQAAPVDARVFKGTVTSAHRRAQPAPHSAEAAQQDCRSNDSDADTGTAKATNIHIGQSGTPNLAGSIIIDSNIRARRRP